MTSDGGPKLRRIIDDDEQVYVSITIEKLVVSSTVSGPFLLRIGEYTDAVDFEQYRDAVFQLPPGTSLNEIAIGSGRALRSFIAGENIELQSLEIQNCLLDRIPPTLGKMVNLLQLSINQCQLTALRMDALAENRNLFKVDLSENRIRQLFPLTVQWRSQGLSVQYMILTSNQIEYLDMASFAHLTLLEGLDMRENGIVQLGASAPVILPNLARLNVALNRITSIDLANATLSKLSTFFLDGNALRDLPVHWGTLPNLVTLSLETNNLTRPNLSVLSPFKKLGMLDLSSNQIESLRASTPCSLSHLDVLDLSDNHLSRLTQTGCNFPNITSIQLSKNQFTTVPPLFQRFPNVHLVLDRNPIKCSTLTPLKNRLVDGRLYVNNIVPSMACDTTSSIVVQNYSKVCCNA